MQTIQIEVEYGDYKDAHHYTKDVEAHLLLMVQSWADQARASVRDLDGPTLQEEHDAQLAERSKMAAAAQQAATAGDATAAEQSQQDAERKAAVTAEAKAMLQELIDSGAVIIKAVG